MRSFVADLHVHTALSPCAADEMTPPAIVERAAGLGLAMIAVCDHNSAGNAAATQEAAAGRLAVLAGIEVTTCEEVHVLGLFPDARAAEAAGRAVLATLPGPADAAQFDPRRFGEQRLVGPAGEDRGREPRLLFAASGFDLAGAIGLIKRHGGLAVAAHVDRPSFSVVSQLGQFPNDAGFDAAEVSAARARGDGERGMRGAEWRAKAGIPQGLPVVCGSDAHFLGELGAGATLCEMAEATFDEVALALRGAAGRSIVGCLPVAQIGNRKSQIGNGHA